jgi:DNA-binding CsgD family transcriptional regulator
MDESIEQALSEREKQTLRLLLGGHEAKSIAKELGLSVHTVNERLRDARRKLGVSSSREAARILADAEQTRPNSLGDKGLGVRAGSDRRQMIDPSNQRRGAGHSLAWLGGGMLIMSLIIAAAVLSSAPHMTRAAQPQGAAAATAASPSTAAAESAARAWVGLIDRAAWADSWAAAGALFKSQLTQPQWVSTIQTVRQPLGAVSSRTLQGVTPTNALPNVPPGEYAVVQYRTEYANKPAASETVILAHESTGWKVDGYFIR